MPTLDTSNWINAGNPHGLTTQALSAFTSNVTNGYTLNESYGRANSGNDRTWSCGVEVVQGVGFSPGGYLCVRPPQRFTWTGAINGQNHHIHFVPNITSLRLYGAVQEGASGTPTATGVIGIGIESIRLSSLGATSGIPTGNAAGYELDIWVWDSSDYSRMAILLNYPITTTGHGSNFDPYTNRIWLPRGPSSGVINAERVFLTHNTQSNAWSWFGGLSVQNWFLDNSRYLVAYRIHSVEQPYYITNEVPQLFNTASIFAQQGIYAASTGEDHSITVTGNAHAGASPVVMHHQDVERHAISPHSEATANSSIVYRLSRAHTIAVNAVARAAAGLTLGVGHSVRATATTTTTILLRLHGLLAGVPSNVTPTTRLTYIVTRADGSQETNETEGDNGFLQTAGRRLWRMLGLPG